VLPPKQSRSNNKEFTTVEIGYVLIVYISRQRLVRLLIRVAVRFPAGVQPALHLLGDRRPEPPSPRVKKGRGIAEMAA